MTPILKYKDLAPSVPRRFQNPAANGISCACPWTCHAIARSDAYGHWHSRIPV